MCHRAALSETCSKKHDSLVKRHSLYSEVQKNNNKTNIKIQIAGVPKSQAALVYLITAHHLCAFLMYLAR